MTVQIDLRGRRLLVVGGSAGIGRAAALSAAAAGPEIAVVGRSPEKIAGRSPPRRASDRSSYITGTTLHPDGAVRASAGWWNWPDAGWVNMLPASTFDAG
jgi:NAD(P)-dependent dehydrogenase (short-subunit alcohol dehydrogenase family)